jgi:hypothetical protein
MIADLIIGSIIICFIAGWLAFLLGLTTIGLVVTGGGILIFGITSIAMTIHFKNQKVIENEK